MSTPLLFLSVCLFGLLRHRFLLFLQAAKWVGIAGFPLTFFASPVMTVFAEALFLFQSLDA